MKVSNTQPKQKRRPSAASDNIGPSDKTGMYKRRYVPCNDGHSALPPKCNSSVELDAASVILQAWRWSHMRRALSSWESAKVTVDQFKDVGFEETTKLMRTAKVMQSSERLMQALLLTSASDNHKVKAPGRVFVTGFLFAAHGQLLVTGSSHMDSIVLSAAETMTRSYAEFSKAFKRPGWYEQQQTFTASFMAFNEAFESWKQSDSRLLLTALERHYLELDRLWQTVQRKTGGKGDEDWRIGIKNQRQDLLDKIRALGGTDAVNGTLQRQRDLRTTYQNPQPSQTPSLSSDQAGAESQSNAGTFSTASGPSYDQLSAVISKAIVDPQAQDVDRVLESYNLTASSALQNVRLAHELILDPEAHLKADLTSGKIVDTYFKNIDDRSASLVPVLEQLRAEMHTIIPPNNRLHVSLNSELDSQWMETQANNQALDVRDKLQRVLDMLSKLCAPIRDKAVSELKEQVDALDSKQTSEIVDALRKVFVLIRLLRVDVLNHQLESIVRPWLRAHAVEYEREKMALLLKERCRNASEIIEQTTKWMQPAAVQVRSRQRTGTRGNFAQQVFKEALLDLCFASTALTPESAPITLSLDQARIQAIQNEIQVLLSAGALNALIKSMLRRQNIKLSTDEQQLQIAPAILATLRSPTVTMDEIVSTIIGLCKSIPEEPIGRLVHKTLSKDDPVYQAMEAGMRRFIAARIDKLKSTALAKQTQDAKIELAKLSLAVVDSNVCALTEHISRLYNFNWQVHSQWYAKVTIE
ncbi:hypothetical protein LPJ68_005797 [Coemansia sp. RSA 1086]|nr:hypothetical protein LPJ68_005797 [Coemansia sp. RSA 1086]